MIDPDVLQDHEVDYIQLDRCGEGLTISSLDEAIKTFVCQLDHKEHKTFVVDLAHTGINKDTESEISKSSIVFINEANVDRHFDIPGCQGLFKAVSTLENVVCIFPSDTSPSLCKKIAVAFSNEFSKLRHDVPSKIA